MAGEAPGMVAAGGNSLASPYFAQVSVVCILVCVCVGGGEQVSECKWVSERK